MQQNNKPLWIVFEGPDGVGKTTQLNALEDFYTERGYNVCRTAEPWTSEYGKRLRRNMENHDKEPLSSVLKFQLFVSDRLEHIAHLKNLRDVLTRGSRQPYLILQDRFWPSTCVYQQRVFPIEFMINLFMEFQTQPDYTIFLLPTKTEDIFDRLISKGEKPANNVEKIIHSYSHLVNILELRGYPSEKVYSATREETFSRLTQCLA